MNAIEELARVARYALPPALAYAVGKGWIPAEMQQPLLEAAVVEALVYAILNLFGITPELRANALARTVTFRSDGSVIEKVK